MATPKNPETEPHDATGEFIDSPLQDEAVITYMEVDADVVPAQGRACCS